MKMNMKFRYISLVVLLCVLAAGGCKEKDVIYDDPYQGGRAPLGVKIDPQQVPSPAEGDAGTIVTIAGTGLLPYKDKLKFLFNGETAEVMEVSATGVKVKVPVRASSGVTLAVIDGMLVFGPKFTVTGRVKADPTYAVTSGANGPVMKIIPLSTGRFLLLGGFTNYDNRGSIRANNRIVRTFSDGSIDANFGSGNGANGVLTGMAEIAGQYYIAGGFSGFAQRNDGIGNITRISSAGAIDTVLVRTYTQGVKLVPTFNGGTDALIRSVYAINNQIVATGDFRYYLSRRYDQPDSKYKDSTIIDTVEVRQLVRFNTDGTLDKTWRFDPNAIGYRGRKGRSLPGATGRLYSLMHEDGRLLAYGQFNKFDDVSVGYITRLKADGSIDPTFNPGTGADNYIDHVSYNATFRKYLVVGRFKKFNGKPYPNMVMLNEDGSIDQNFVPDLFDGGSPFFGKQLSDKLCVISGDFKTYSGVSRQGFLVVDENGKLAAGYNTIGNVLGAQYRVNDIIETKTEDDKRALLIGGEFTTFDNRLINNIIRVSFAPRP